MLKLLCWRLRNYLLLFVKQTILFSFVCRNRVQAVVAFCLAVRHEFPVVVTYGNLLQVNAECIFRYAASRWFGQALHVLASSGVKGVAVNVWVRCVRRLFAVYLLLQVQYYRGSVSLYLFFKEKPSSYLDV